MPWGGPAAKKAPTLRLWLAAPRGGAFRLGAARRQKSPHAAPSACCPRGGAFRLGAARRQKIAIVSRRQRETTPGRSDFPQGGFPQGGFPQGGFPRRRRRFSARTHPATMKHTGKQGLFYVRLAQQYFAGSAEHRTSHRPGSHGRRPGQRSGHRRGTCRRTGLPALRHAQRGPDTRTGKPVPPGHGSPLEPELLLPPGPAPGTRSAAGMAAAPDALLSRVRTGPEPGAAQGLARTILAGACGSAGRTSS